LALVLCDDLGLRLTPVLHDGHVNAVYHDGIGDRCLEFGRDRIYVSGRIDPDHFGRAMSEDEFIAVHRCNRAVYWMAHSRREDEGLKMIEEALVMFPDYAGGRLNRASLLLRMGRFQEASDELDLILRLPLGAQFLSIAHTLGAIGSPAGQR